MSSPSEKKVEGESIPVLKADYAADAIHFTESGYQHLAQHLADLLTSHYKL